jgi:hypothetical protein
MRGFVITLGVALLGCAVETPGKSRVRVAAPDRVALPAEAMPQDDAGGPRPHPICHALVSSRARSPAPTGSIVVKRSRLPDDRYRVRLAATERHLYVVGGSVHDRTPMTSSVSPDVFVASLGTSGDVGPWQATTPLPIPRGAHAAAACGRFLYVIGGCSSGCGISDMGDMDRLFRGRIAEDGSIERWEELRSLPDGVYHHTAVAYDRFLFVIGGLRHETRDTMWRAPITPDGSIGRWVQDRALPEWRKQHVSLVLDDRLYVAYGNGPSGWLSNVLVSRIRNDGSLEPWKNLGSSPSPRTEGALAELARMTAQGKHPTSLAMDEALQDTEATQIVVGDFVYQVSLGATFSVARLP